MFARHYAAVSLEKMSKDQVKKWLRRPLPDMSEMGFAGEQLSKVEDDKVQDELKVKSLEARAFCRLREKLQKAGGFNPTDYASITMGPIKAYGSGEKEFTINAATFYRGWEISDLEDRDVEITYDADKDQTTVKCSAVNA